MPGSLGGYLVCVGGDLSQGRGDLVCVVPEDHYDEERRTAAHQVLLVLRVFVRDGQAHQLLFVLPQQAAVAFA
jgi:hypothetical protein